MYADLPATQQRQANIAIFVHAPYQGAARVTWLLPYGVNFVWVLRPTDAVGY
jgi:hypothetical protein